MLTLHRTCISFRAGLLRNLNIVQLVILIIVQYSSTIDLVHEIASLLNEALNTKANPACALAGDCVGLATSSMLRTK